MNIKELRDKYHLSQQELADKTGIPRDRIAKWEQGKGTPKAEDDRKINEFFFDLGFGEEIHNSEEEPRKESRPSSAMIHDMAENNKVLFEANKTLADANKRLADAHFILAEGNLKLINILEDFFGKGLVSSYTESEQGKALGKGNPGPGNLFEDLAQDKSQKAGKR